MESLQELWNILFTWSFVPLAWAIVLLSVVGSGLWHLRRKRAVWLLAVVLLAVTFYLGIQRQEWGEVLFNGKIL